MLITKNNLMSRKLYFIIIAILALVFCQVESHAQTMEKSEKTIYLMRDKQLYGSLAKMNLMINDNLFYKIKNGERLIIKASSDDVLNIQIVYPPMKRHKSEILQILPDDEDEIYIDLFYWGEGYNPIKHAGVLNVHGGLPDFNIGIIKMNKEEGEDKFHISDNYKGKKISERTYP